MAKFGFSRSRGNPFGRGLGGAVALLVVAGAACLAKPYLGNVPGDTALPTAVAAGTHNATIKRVVDGDTLVLADGAKVRLIGVDTPETVKQNHPVEPFGPEATQFTQSFVAHGDVRLEFDREKYDQYNRLLAYVWVGDRMLNVELVRAGLARVERQYSYAAARKAEFSLAEAEAQRARRGIWSQGR